MKYLKLFGESFSTAFINTIAWGLTIIPMVWLSYWLFPIDKIAETVGVFIGAFVRSACRSYS